MRRESRSKASPIRFPASLRSTSFFRHTEARNPSRSLTRPGTFLFSPQPRSEFRSSAPLATWSPSAGLMGRHIRRRRTRLRSIYVLHDLKTLQINPVERGIDVRPLPCAEGRYRGRRALSGSRKSGAAALQAAQPSGVTSIVAKAPANGYSRPRGRIDSLPECPFKAAEGPDGEA
jgi:hypothetical protein